MKNATTIIAIASVLALLLAGGVLQQMLRRSGQTPIVAVIPMPGAAPALRVDFCAATAWAVDPVDTLSRLRREIGAARAWRYSSPVPAQLQLRCGGSLGAWLAALGIRLKKSVTGARVSIYDRTYPTRIAPARFHRTGPSPSSPVAIQDGPRPEQKPTLAQRGKKQLLERGQERLRETLGNSLQQPQVKLDAGEVQKYTVSSALDATTATAKSDLKEKGPQLDATGSLSGGIHNASSQVEQQNQQLENFNKHYGSRLSLLNGDPVSNLSGLAHSRGLESNKKLQVLSEQIQSHASDVGLDSLGNLTRNVLSQPSSLMGRLGVGATSGATPKTAGRTTGNTKETPDSSVTGKVLTQISSQVARVHHAVRQRRDVVTGGAGSVTSAALNTAGKGNPVAEQAAVTLGAISATSRSIIGIIATVNDIVVQANVLALNMVVDTTGATLKGKGMDTASKEFHGIAQRAIDAATKIGKLVQGGVSSVQCIALPSDPKARADALAQAVEQLSGVVQDMTSLATDQLLGMQQLEAAMSLLEKMAQLNHALIEDVANLGENLLHQARRLLALITRFETDSAENRFAGVDYGASGSIYDPLPGFGFRSRPPSPFIP